MGMVARKSHPDAHVTMEHPMSVTSPILSQFSDALSDLASGARGFVAGVRTESGHLLSGVLWRRDAVVVSEQSLPDSAEYEVRVADRSVKAKLAGRDQGTNVAVLKLESDIPAALPQFSEVKVGALALVLGASDEGVSARLALVRSVSGAWESAAGGAIDRRIVLDTAIRSDEGGPVLAADGTILGISTHGARRQTLVIPASTVGKAVGVLLEKGTVERGWLGVALRPVALPEPLRPDAGQRVGLMVMDVAGDSPAQKAGIVAGDIILSAAGMPVSRFGSLTRQLGPASIGKHVELRVARAGAFVMANVTIESRKPA
jgi:S1-C subfamily serine protease